MSRGQYVDLAAGKITFKRYVTDWLKTLTIDAGSIVMMELRLRIHVFPHLGDRPLNSIQPVHARQCHLRERLGCPDRGR